MTQKIRVRFCPSPTGYMHLGNVRAALMNYLFAKGKNGTFILRIEDTDKKRNIQEAREKIIEDLAWLGLPYQEGPGVGGNFGPYLQSERTELYQEKLNILVEKSKVYRCFCSEEDLEIKRQQQVAAGLPPRYDKTCLRYTDDQAKKYASEGREFLWRFKINPHQHIEFHDMSKRRPIKFDMKNFFDFAITRRDGSFTFMFVNMVDDWLMKISHVMRGEDHLNNTVMQAAMYKAFDTNLPIFWHLPIICNLSGEKLSKRDFGFALNDLRQGGFLPEAVNNYLATIGASFDEEVQSTDQLAQSFDFDKVHSTGTIKYDVEKLTWFNHKWIDRLELNDLTNRIKPFLYNAFPESKHISDEKLSFLIGKIKSDLKTLKDVQSSLRFCFIKPHISKETIEEKFGKDTANKVLGIINQITIDPKNTDEFLNYLKKQALSNGLKVREIFGTIRYLLTGQFQGLGMHELLEMLDSEEIRKRLLHSL